MENKMKALDAQLRYPDGEQGIHLDELILPNHFQCYTGII